MGLIDIRQKLVTLCWRFLVGTVERVPEWNQICEFECHAAACDWEKWESCGRRLGLFGEVRGQEAPFVRRQNGAAKAAKHSLSASDVAREVLGPNSNANISNVLVLVTENPTPLKRTEIRFGDPREVPATLNALEVALQRSGVDFRAVRNPDMPKTEIWLTSPLHDGRRTLLSCAVITSNRAADRVAAQAGVPTNQAQ